MEPITHWTHLRPYNSGWTSDLTFSLPTFNVQNVIQSMTYVNLKFIEPSTYVHVTSNNAFSKRVFERKNPMFNLRQMDANVNVHWTLLHYRWPAHHVLSWFLPFIYTIYI